MQLSDLRTEVRNVIQDSGASPNWTDTEIKGYLNEAQLDFCRRTKLLRTSATLVVDGTKTPATANYTVPSDVISVDRLQAAGKELPLTDVTTLALFRTNWATETGTPSSYLLGEYGPLLIRVHPYPTVAATNLVLFYARTPATLSGDSDVPEIPAEYHLALTYYAIAKAYLKDFDLANPGKSAAWRALYDQVVALVTGATTDGPANAS